MEKVRTQDMIEIVRIWEDYLFELCFSRDFDVEISAVEYELLERICSMLSDIVQAVFDILLESASEQIGHELKIEILVERFNLFAHGCNDVEEA